MGYIRHHMIAVTGSDKHLTAAHETATRLFSDGGVSPIVESHMNGYISFFIAPDGSKEGWADSAVGDTRRDAFIAVIKDDVYLDWVEVQYGDDNNEAKIIRHSDEAAERDK